MSQINVTFDQKNIVIPNDKCCLEGITVLMNIDNIIPGHVYYCELSAIDQAAVAFTQNNFNIISATTSVVVPIGLTLNNGLSRSHIIKCKITDLDYRQSYRYWIPNKNEWYKAAYYNPVSETYYTYATQNNVQPDAATSDSNGDGICASSGNCINFASAAIWNELTGNVSTVGTNGDASYYGTYDQNGNVCEWIDDEASIRYKPYAGGSWASSITAIKDIIDAKVITSSSKIGFRVAAAINRDLEIDTNEYVLVSGTEAPNVPDVNGLGSTRYTFYIKKYPVTNAEYALFLNSVAATSNTHSLYHLEMTNDNRGGIIRTINIDNTYNYACKENMANKPVNFVTWLDCARYCNWLHNKSFDINNNNTETGAYDLSQSSLAAPYTGLNYSEDILTIQCGMPSKPTVVFSDASIVLPQTSKCADTKHLIANIQNAKIGREYAYYFSSTDPAFASIIPHSGTIIASSATQNINTVYAYAGSLQKVELSLKIIDLVDNTQATTSLVFQCKDCKPSSSTPATN